MSNLQEGIVATTEKKYKGVRRRKWGKWVSEIRVPGTQDRLWLGSYSTPEAAAVAHDTALFCLRGPSFMEHLNFPMYLPGGLRTDMSPKSIQKTASDAGMAVDVKLATTLHENVENVNEIRTIHSNLEGQLWDDENDNCNEYREGEPLSISVDDMEICI